MGYALMQTYRSILSSNVLLSAIVPLMPITFRILRFIVREMQESTVEVEHVNFRTNLGAV